MFEPLPNIRPRGETRNGASGQNKRPPGYAATGGNNVSVSDWFGKFSLI